VDDPAEDYFWTKPRNLCRTSHTSASGENPGAWKQTPAHPKTMAL